MRFFDLFRRSNPQNEAADALYKAIVEKSRDAAFYAQFGVPDTVDGRFDMIVIHAMLAFRQLRKGGKDAEATAQALFDLMFKDMDRSLREMGVGDLSVSRHIRKMAKAFYGRAAMYEEGLDGDAKTLKRALEANLFRQGIEHSENIDGVAGYLRRAAAHIDAQDVSDVINGRLNLDVSVLGMGNEQSPSA